MPSQPVLMDSFNGDANAEREEFQRRSDAYQPDVQGDLVKQKESITNLITEYQNADQAFVTKLATLSRDHPTYRPIKGDGKCGWTAVVFGYFETLLSLKSAAKIQAEMARLRAFNHHIEAIGCDLSMVEFAMDFTFEFMQNMHDNIITGNTNEAMIRDTFNSEYVSNGIIYHFKLMTSAFMQLNSELYSYFVEVPLGEYCRNFIEPQGQEIDNSGLQALASGVIAPGGMALDVLYLDRSAGSEVTPHHLVDASPTQPVITLLYRPGHYDLIYKETAAVQVHHLQHVPEFVPNFSSPAYYSNLEVASMLSPDASLATNYAASMAPYQPVNFAQWNLPTTFAPSNPTTPTELSTVSEERPFPPQLSSPSPEDPIRFNGYTYLTPFETTMPLTTAVFKNSPFNPNHFRNQSFHPQQYNPEDQNNKSSRTRRSSSTKSSRPKTTTRQNSGSAVAISTPKRK